MIVKDKMQTPHLREVITVLMNFPVGATALTAWAKHYVSIICKAIDAINVNAKAGTIFSLFLNIFRTLVELHL